MTTRAPFVINLKKLEKFLASKTNTEKCPFCDSDDWSIPTSGGIAMGAIPWGATDGNMFPVGLPVITLVCKQCYFVRMMAMHEPSVQKALSGEDDAE